MNGCFDCGMDAGLAGERGSARVVACGVPCRVMRAITPADRDRYPFHESIAAKYGSDENGGLSVRLCSLKRL